MVNLTKETSIVERGVDGTARKQAITCFVRDMLSRGASSNSSRQRQVQHYGDLPLNQDVRHVPGTASNSALEACRARHNPQLRNVVSFAYAAAVVSSGFPGSPCREMFENELLVVSISQIEA